MTGFFRRAMAVFCAALLLAACSRHTGPVRGIHAVLSARAPDGGTITAAQWERSMTVLRNVLAAHAPDERVARTGADRIAIDMPGYGDIAAFRRLFLKPLRVSFRMVDETADESALAAGQARPGTTILSFMHAPARLAVYDTPIVAAAHVADAQRSFDGTSGEPIVNFRFDAEGRAAFAAATQANIGNRFAIVVDGKIVSAPFIREPILDGTGMISGAFTEPEAIALADMLLLGAAPLRLRLVSAKVMDIAE